MRRRVVLLTGCTRGIGRAMAEEFIHLGHTVCGCGRSKDEVTSLKRQFAAPHSFHVVDVASDAEVKKWAAEVLAASGPPDLLLNNAGVINRSAPLWEVQAEEFAAVIDTNLKGPANVLRHFLPSMLEARRGIIVNFSSGWGRSVDANVAAYCATKWGIEGLTQALAREVPRGMAAIPLNPGVIDTAMLRSCFGSSAAGYITPKDWAKTAVPFLLKLRAADNGKPLDAPA